MKTVRVSLLIMIIVHARGPGWSVLQNRSAADVESIDGTL